MSEMVERLAKVLYDQDMAQEPMNHYRLVARAAIAAMREPTDEMLGSVYGLCGEQRGSDRAAREVWQTMIDEALK